MSAVGCFPEKRHMRRQKTKSYLCVPWARSTRYPKTLLHYIPHYKLMHKISPGCKNWSIWNFGNVVSIWNPQCPNDTYAHFKLYWDCTSKYLVATLQRHSYLLPSSNLSPICIYYECMHLCVSTASNCYDFTFPVWRNVRHCAPAWPLWLMAPSSVWEPSSISNTSWLFYFI